MEYTPHQTQIIKRYYSNRESIMTQKLSELTTELFLAEGKKREKVWQRITAALTQLGVEPAMIELLVGMDNPAKLAEFLERRR